ncbi:facilitated trehalose transporter Tret1-like [Oratosquilla oratoria]|uniref:facilitated trehalose transporter Tret1-like n=1 Tax=Oratosquilla oratoria TaxID=337810 RepID=UPI003F757572
MPNDSRETPICVLPETTIDKRNETQYHSDTSVLKGTNIDDLSTAQRPQLFIQVCGCLVASLSQVGVACIFTFSGVTIPELTSSNNTDLFLDKSSTALFGSLPNMGAIFGSLLTGALTVSVGQRVILLLVLPFTLLCWLGIAFANSVPLLLGARFLLGLTVATLKHTPYIYVIEISHEMYRGNLSGIIDVMRGLGMIFSYSIGSLSLTWRQMALVFGFTTTIPQFIGLLFFHDSPRWLASKGYLEKSSKALQFFRGRQYNIDQEFADITIKAKESLCFKSNAFSQIKHLADPSIRKRFAIICLMILLRVMGGSNILLSYTATIFNETNSCSNPHICSILVGVGRTVGAILFFFSSDYIGRRPGFIFSSLVCSVSMYTLGLYFYISVYYEGELVTSLSWIPLVSVLVISCCASTATAIQSLISCEILPLSFRLMGNGMISTISYTLSFTVVETFLPLKSALGFYGVFWLYSFFLALSSYVPLAFLPETKGKTLEEIEDAYKNVEDRK